MAEEIAKEKSTANRTVYIQPTTGGQIEINISADSSVNNLKRAVANRLRVPKDKIVLLFKNKQLSEGSLDENSIVEGARIILLPSVETGIMGQRGEQCVMQALEALNETQVDNFLAGRSPLNLTMRIGDHMMFIQLQLSTISPPPNNNNNTNNNNNRQNVSSLSLSSVLTPPSTPTTPNPPGLPLRLSAAAPMPPSPPPSPRVPSAEADARPAFSNHTLAEASRSLTHTLRHISSAALSQKMNEACDGRCCIARKKGGAVIESMFHHGRGVYSGTFSGTLNPSLQDGHGRPRRDISTVIQILNDLLGASSHCRPSVQCLCPTTPSSPQNPPGSNSSVVKADGQQKQQENKMLREKMEQIQQMLKEKRQKRKARRSVRPTPYSTNIRKTGSTNSSKPNFESDNMCTTIIKHNTECVDQNVIDYSSETAVA